MVVEGGVGGGVVVDVVKEYCYSICTVTISYTAIWTLTCRSQRCWHTLVKAGATIWVNCRNVLVYGTITLTIRASLNKFQKIQLNECNPICRKSKMYFL